MDFTNRLVREDRAELSPDVMTDKDRKLIEQALDMSYIDWGIVCDMEEQADTEEARDILHGIGRRLYHTDEYYADLL